MSKINWTAVCKYVDHEKFNFYSSAFTVDHWSDLDSRAEELVRTEWARFSPYPAPPIVELVPGYVAFVEERK